MCTIVMGVCCIVFYIDPINTQYLHHSLVLIFDHKGGEGKCQKISFHVIFTFYAIFNIKECLLILCLLLI